MRRWIVLAVLAAFVVGCAQDAPARVETRSPAPTASMTASPSITPDWTATPNFEGTRQALDAELAAARNTSEASKATEQRLAALDGTQQANTYSTATATVAVGLTQRVEALQTLGAAQTATLQAPLVERERIRTAWEPTWQLTLWLSFVALALLLAFRLTLVTSAWVRMLQAKRSFYLSSEETADEQEPLKVAMSKVDPFGWGSVSFSTLPIGKDVLREVAELIISGGSYTQEQMTGSGRPLVKGGTYNSFGEWMVRNKIAKQLSDGRYLILQEDFFRQVLIEFPRQAGNTPSPAVESA